MTRTLNITALLLIQVSVAFGQIPSKADQIAAAIQAAPEGMRDGAGVLGYDADGKLVELKPSTNSMICLADDPNKDNFSAACYHQDLEQFMARGRALRLEGKNPKQINEIREQEAKSGKMKMPDKARTLHILYGNDGKYNTETGDVENAKYRYVVYIPYATAESTGLSPKPITPGHPWIMFPGTYRAHIMITPPKVE